ncbi:MAG: sigma-70 family RNA polymerase sigma factor [Myxococcota bacterium]
MRATPTERVGRFAPTFVRVYQDHLRYVWRLLGRCGVPSRDREDVAHDTFVVVHRKLPEFDASRPLRPWLTGITIRVALAYRRRRMHGEVPSELPEITCPVDAYRAEHREEALALLKVLAFEQRVVFVLFEVEGLTAPEIAEALSIPLNTVYSRLRLARNELRRATASLELAPRQDAATLGPVGFPQMGF